MESPASALLEALGYALFLRDETGALRLQGAPPDWLGKLWPGLTKSRDALPLEQASPFLENFLFDAAECWSAGGEKRARSGPWVEQGADGVEISLEAIALTLNQQPALLLEKLGAVFEEKKSMLQKARETVIAYQRLNSETQKKEILLSCIAEEMNTALANAITSLRLIELQKNSPRTQQLLTLAMRATEEQQALIRKVLHVFAAELEVLYGRDGDAAADASLGEAIQAAADVVAESFAEKRVGLRLTKSGSRVAMNADQLTRVIVSLLENALRHSPNDSEVSLEIEETSEATTVRLLDLGAVLPNEIADNFFARSVAADENAPPQLSLQFCRMAVENCHGEIGCAPRANGLGNCFWIRLPKVGAP
jgi:K+-sensing histidine kinase KdpD